MRVALGTIDVSDTAREAIAAYYGESGMASRDTTRRFIIDNGAGDIDNQIAVLQARDDDD